MSELRKSATTQRSIKAKMGGLARLSRDTLSKSPNRFSNLSLHVRLESWDRLFAVSMIVMCDVNDPPQQLSSFAGCNYDLLIFRSFVSHYFR